MREFFRAAPGSTVMDKGSRALRMRCDRPVESLPRWNGGMMSEISELFSRNPWEKPHTDEELDRIIEYLRRLRREWANADASCPSGHD
jgi:hypothetical protein